MIRSTIRPRSLSGASAFGERLALCSALAALAALCSALATPALAVEEESATPGRAERAVERMEAALAGVEPLSLTFRQLYASSVFGGDESESGVVFIVPPARMLWRYDEPEGRRAVFDGRSWWLVEPLDREVVTHEGGEGDLVSSLLVGRSDLLELFEARVAEGQEGLPEGLLRVVLVPRELRDDVERVLVDVREESAMPARVEIVDPVGSRIVYEFSEPLGLESPPPGAFRLVVPEGYTITRQ